MDNLDKRDHWALNGAQLPTLRKSLRMMVNLDVDGYTKTLNHRKIFRQTQKQQPTENQNNTKTKI